MMNKLVCVILAISFAVALADTSCTATASLTRGESWSDGVNNFANYAVSVMNTGSCELYDVKLRLSITDGALISQSWNLNVVDSQNSIYALTNFGSLILLGASYDTAGFIVQYSSTVSVAISVTSTSCAPCGTPTGVPGTPTGGPTGKPTPTTPPFSADLIQQLITAPSELQRQNILKDGDYVFDFRNSQLGVTQSAGGKTVATSRSNFPAVIGHDIAMTVGYIEACGINLPHTHPRATEINFIASGRFQAGFFLENGARFIGNTLEAGMATVFPKGAIHFEINLGCEPAVFVAAFNNEDPGVQTTASSFFGLPSDVAAISLNISSIQTVEDLARHLPHNPAIAMRECMVRCGFTTEAK